MALPKVMKAVYVSKEGRELKEYPVPAPAEGEVLIKNEIVSSNPKDWKLPLWMEGYAAVEGNDVAGTVVSVGEGVKRFKVGDKVAAFSKMRTDDKYGAYAEYTVATEGCTFALGKKTTYEQGAGIPLAYMTAAIGLFVRLGLPTPAEPSKDNTAILVYGGATTVGVYAIQLAKMAGLHVVAVAGSSDHAKAYGADEVITYRDKSPSEIGAEIARAAGGRIRHIYDAVTEPDTVTACLAGLGSNGGTYTYVLPISEEQLGRFPKNVKEDRTLVATAYGDDSAFATEYFDLAGRWLEEGRLKEQKTTLLPGGLAGVEEGLRRLQKGEVRAEKLIYRIADTPGLAQADK